jgi:hypothetical protein
MALSITDFDFNHPGHPPRDISTNPMAPTIVDLVGTDFQNSPLVSEVFAVDLEFENFFTAAVSYVSSTRLTLTLTAAGTWFGLAGASSYGHVHRTGWAHALFKLAREEKLKDKPDDRRFDKLVAAARKLSAQAGDPKYAFPAAEPAVKKFGGVGDLIVTVTNPDGNPFTVDAMAINILWVTFV